MEVEQVRFIAEVRSLNEEEFKKNLSYFEVPSTSVEPIRSKLTMIIFDEYAIILKGMYSIRFNGRPDHGGNSDRPDNGSSDHGDTPVVQLGGPRLLLSTLSQSGSLTKLENVRKGRKRERNN